MDLASSLTVDEVYLVGAVLRVGNSRSCTTVAQLTTKNQQRECMCVRFDLVPWHQGLHRIPVSS